jgi:hypothetical protein
MAKGTWDDFTDKYGFADGAQTTSWDFEVRDTLVGLLNDHPITNQKYRYEAYDRPGCHNPCLILTFRKEGDTNTPVPADVDDFEDVIEDLIDQAYESGAKSRIGD